MYLLGSYLSYLFISLCITVWVARTLQKNGRIFLVDAFRGNEPLADSVNQLLLVGFYLINIGCVSMAMRSGIKPDSLDEVMEFLSTKVGLVLLVLGVMHFLNIRIFSVMRRRGIAAQRVAPQAEV